MSRVTNGKGRSKMSVGEAASRVGEPVHHTVHTHGSRDKLSFRIKSRLSHPDRFSPPHVHGAASPSPRLGEPGARAMPPLTGVGERCAPRATWSCIDEPLKSPGRSRSASLPTPVKGRAWRHRLLREAFMSTVTVPSRSLKLPRMLDEPNGSLPSTCSHGHAVQNEHVVLNAKQCWVGEARSRRCVTPIHGREVPRGLQILMRVPDRIAQSAMRGRAPQARQGSSVPCLKVASPERPLLKRILHEEFLEIKIPSVKLGVLYRRL